MRKAVTVTLWSQRDGEEPVTLTATGTLEGRKDGPRILRYPGENGQQNIITLEPERVTVECRGEICYRMVFRAGCRHSGRYETPYGALEMAVVTHGLDTSGVEHGGFSTAYHLVFNGEETPRTRLRLTTDESPLPTRKPEEEERTR